VMKYGGISETDALRLITINPATILHVGDRTGSIKAGKDADLVLWTDYLFPFMPVPAKQWLMVHSILRRSRMQKWRSR